MIHAVGGAIRKAAGGTGASPDDKKPKTDQEGLGEQFEEVAEEDNSKEDIDVSEMMKIMMKDMKDMKRMIQKSDGALEQVKVDVNSAKQSAFEANIAVKGLEGEVQQLKEAAMTKEQVVEVVKATIQQGEKEAFDPWASAAANKPAAGVPSAYMGKGGAKGEAKMEKRQRSIVFNNFPEDTKEAVIKTAIWETLSDVQTEIEEVFTYSKHDSAGVARFKTAQGMWNYMQSNAGHNRHNMCGQTIYVNADRAAAPTDDEAKDRAIRKFVRAIIEGNGGDGAEVKKQMDAKYKKGIVIWKDERVAEWCVKEQKLMLKGEGLQYQKAYDVLIATIRRKVEE